MVLTEQSPKKIYKGSTEIKAVYLGENKVRPPYKPRTFTISRTEQSNMSSGWTYSDDAAGLTAGSGDFDDFFGYSAVLLNTSGVETAEMKQSGGVFTGAMTTLGNITSGDNVMIKFPVRGIKMSKSGSTVTLSITEELNKDGYQYYAFNDKGTTKDILYLGAYKGTKSGNLLKSWSGTSSIGSFSLDSSVAAANAYSGGRHHEITFYARNFIAALYMMKYGNPNAQSVIGMGYNYQGTLQTTGATNSITNATGATDTTNTGRIKLFGLEDRFGNIGERLDGANYSSSSNLRVSSTQAFSTSSKITTFDKNISTTTGWIKSITGTNDGMFVSNASGGNTTTYYTDRINYSSGNYVYAGANGANGLYAQGVFRLNGDSSSTTSYGARLMYL